LLSFLVMSIVEWRRTGALQEGDGMKDERKTKAQSVLDMEKEKDRESRG